MFCMNCGAQILDGQAFCDKCGAPQPVEEPVAAQPVAEPVVAAQPVAQPVQPEPVSYAQPVAQPVAAEPVIDAQAEQKGNGAAVTGLVFGILTLVLGWIPVLGVIFFIVGLICSIVGLVKVKKVHKGKGPAIGGLITSIVGLADVVISIILASVLILGIGTYLDRAKAASDMVDAHYAEIETVDIDSEIERVLS